MINAKVITIGDEILLGQIVDTNSHFIANELKAIGVKLDKISTVSDTYSDIMEILERSQNKYNIVIITGGLGPTKDDITKKCLCDFFKTELVENKDVVKRLESIFIPKYGELTAVNREQALVPKNAIVINNPVGTAPIMWFKEQNTIFVSMPGVPFEMKEAMINKIIPKLKQSFSLPAIYTYTILVTGIGESFLSEKIEGWENSLPENIGLAYLPSPQIVKLRLTAYGSDNEALKIQVSEKFKELEKIIPDNIYGSENENLALNIGKLLDNINSSVSVAESCTGGNIAHLFTENSGSSSYFKGGVVAYDNSVKISLLNVNQNDIEKFGVVSKQIVEQMAVGVKNIMQTDYSIATSGIAGPTGGSEEKPVGTVWLAVATPNGVFSEKVQLFNNREINIQRSSIVGLNMLRLKIK